MVGPVKAMASRLRAQSLGPEHRRESLLVYMEAKIEVFLEHFEVCGREARLGWELLLFQSPVERDCG